MANVDDPVGNQPAGTPPGFEPAISEPSPQIDAARYQALEAYYARTNPVLQEYEKDFDAIVNDEGYRQFSRTSRESYYDMQKRVAAEREAEIPESEKRLLAAFDERLKPFDPVIKDYATRAEREVETAKAAANDFAKRETEFADRLVAEGKITSDQVGKLAKYAMVLHKESVEAGTPRFVGIEEVYKEIYGGAEARATTAKPVARSLRSTAGATGVPGASSTVTDRGDLNRPGGVTRHILGVLNNQRKTG